MRSADGISHFCFQENTFQKINIALFDFILLFYHEKDH